MESAVFYACFTFSRTLGARNAYSAHFWPFLWILLPEHFRSRNMDRYSNKLINSQLLSCLQHVYFFSQNKLDILKTFSYVHIDISLGIRFFAHHGELLDRIWAMYSLRCYLPQIKWLACRRRAARIYNRYPTDGQLRKPFQPPKRIGRGWNFFKAGSTKHAYNTS